MKKNVLFKIAIIVLLISALCSVIISRVRADQFAPKRQNEHQIIVYQDSNQVELYYHNNDESRTVEIRAQLIIDGPYEVARAVVRPGETVTMVQTTTGDPYNDAIIKVDTGR